MTIFRSRSPIHHVEQEILPTRIFSPVAGGSFERLSIYDITVMPVEAVDGALPLSGEISNPTESQLDEWMSTSVVKRNNADPSFEDAFIRRMQMKTRKRDVQ